jgi:hypothetical protein
MANIEDLRQRQPGPENIQVFVHPQKSFQEAYEESIQARLQAHPRAAAFALVDPFGWTGIPLSVLSDLMKRSNTEILVNFMFEEINRFINHPDQGHNFDGLFGCEEWRQADCPAGRERKKFIVGLYRDQLSKRAGARHVRSFEMRNQRNATDYFLYFASNNRLGLSKMKEAMWKVDPGGGYAFSDATDFGQTVLFEPEPDRRALRRLIAERFATRRATVQQVENFVVEDTPFLATHYRKVLREMEADGSLNVLKPPVGRRRGTYADKAVVDHAEDGYTAERIVEEIFPSLSLEPARRIIAFTRERLQSVLRMAYFVHDRFDGLTRASLSCGTDWRVGARRVRNPEDCCDPGGGCCRL